MKSRILEAVAAAVLLEAWIFAAQAIAELPSRVATHFNWAGTADGYGPPGSLWGLPVMAAVIYLIMTATQFMP